MSEQYTPGPWRAEKVDHRDSDDYEIRDESDALIAETFELIGKHRATVNQRENARRIVACINACEGMATEYLEKFGGTTFSQFREVKHQRDELLDAAERVVARWDSPRWKDQPATGEFINDLRKAIAKEAA